MNKGKKYPKSFGNRYTASMGSEAYVASFMHIFRILIFSFWKFACTKLGLL